MIIFNDAGVHHVLAQGGLEAFPQGGTEWSCPRARIYDNRYILLDLKKLQSASGLGNMTGPLLSNVYINQCIESSTNHCKQFPRKKVLSPFQSTSYQSLSSLRSIHKLRNRGFRGRGLQMITVASGGSGTNDYSITRQWSGE